MKFEKKGCLMALLHTSIAVTLFIVIIHLFFNNWFSATKQRDIIKMPKITDSNVDTLQRFLHKYKLTYRVKKEMNSKNIKKPKGTILTQIPKPGEEIIENREVIITITAMKPDTIVKMPKL